MSEKTETIVVIPKELNAKILKRIEGSEFDSVAEYVLYVLQEVVEDSPTATEYSKKDQERIEARLKSLGYV